MCNRFEHQANIADELFVYRNRHLVLLQGSRGDTDPVRSNRARNSFQPRLTVALSFRFDRAGNAVPQMPGQRLLHIDESQCRLGYELRIPPRGPASLAARPEYPRGPTRS